jgi:hypothetical protein
VTVTATVPFVAVGAVTAVIVLPFVTPPPPPPPPPAPPPPAVPPTNGNR